MLNEKKWFDRENDDTAPGTSNPYSRVEFRILSWASYLKTLFGSSYTSRFEFPADLFCKTACPFLANLKRHSLSLCQLNYYATRYVVLDRASLGYLPIAK
jgi:hypothetical protein